MAYIKQNVQGNYELTVIDKKKSYLLALKSFLINNGFEFISEDYYSSDATKGNLVLQIENMQYDFKVTGSNDNNFSVTISKSLDNNTINGVGNTLTIQLSLLNGTIIDGTSTKSATAMGSTVLLIKNKNSFILLITASENNITSSTNYITGNIAYTLVDGTKSDIGFISTGAINNNNLTAIEKSQGNPVTFSVAHNKLDDDRLIYENKLSVNQSGMFVGDSDEVIGLAGAEKGKIYQTEKGKFLAFGANMGMLMGDEM